MSEPTTPEAPPVAACPTCCRPMGDLTAGGVPGRQPTSRAAGAPSKGTERLAVFRAVAQFNETTADAVAAHLHRSPNQIATRLKELRDGGYVTYVLDDDGRRVRMPTRTGRGAYLQRLTDAGRAWAAANLHPRPLVEVLADTDWEPLPLFD